MKHLFWLDEVHREWACNDVAHNSGEIKRLHRFLLDHKEQMCVLYHGTSADIPVMTEGLKPTSARTRKSLQSQKGFVYLSIYPRHARDFASMAYPGKEVKVYGVTVPIRELMADKDQLRNQRHFAGREIPKDNLTFSLAFGHGARLKRRVWPYEIEEFIP